MLTVNFVNPDDTGKKVVDNERYRDHEELSWMIGKNKGKKNSTG